MPAKSKKFEAKSKQLIQGVQVKQLKWIPDEWGKLMEILRCDDPSSEPAYVVNTVTHPYNHKEPDEFRIDPFDNDIPYDWPLKQGDRKRQYTFSQDSVKKW